MPMSIEPLRPRATMFAGEGRTYRFHQGIDAISGVAAHEAANIVALSAQAARAGQVVIDEAVELQFALDPETGRLVVVGGRSRVTYRPTREQRAPSPPAGRSATIAPPTGEDELAGPAVGPLPGNLGTVLRQAEQALDRRIASIEQLLAGASDTERPLLEAERRALERRRDQIAQAREALALQEATQRAARGSPPDGGAPAETISAGRPGGAPRPPARGIFIPAMTQSGLLVNTSA
jgi:hypothetical protein